MSSPDTSSRAASPVVLCVAPNGARRTQADHPALPMRPDEIAVEAAACADAGASVIHLHVRDDNGAHSLDARRYRDAIAQIRRAVGDRLLIQVTTEAVGRYTPQQQMALLRDLRPEAASIALRELVPHESTLSQAAPFLDWAMREGVALQYIVYDADDVRRLVSWARAGIVPQATPNALFVLGRYTAGQQSAPSQLLPFLQEWPPDWPWSVCAFGQAEAPCMAAAIGLGGHARVGFENNLHGHDGRLAGRNADLVANVADIARRSGRGLASAALARDIYGNPRG